jgi:RNA-binding protein YlmH
MDRKKFISSIKYDENILSKLFDKIELAYKTGNIVFSNEFYPPLIWTKIKEMESSLGVKVYAYGGFEESERQMLAFYTYEKEEFPLKVMYIKANSKFSKLEHKDYLGSLMSLGLKREKFGDLIIHDDICYLALCNDITNYVVENFKSVKQASCSINEITSKKDMPTYAFEERVIITTALRLDCIISSLTNLSRTKSNEYISKGLVLLDYIEVREKDKKVSKNSVITVRGYGKYKIIEDIGESSRGRIKLLTKKYR